MENANELKNLITQANNICLIPNESEPESLTGSLALFYTLKELGKNVNLVSEKFPEILDFLVPSVDYISAPKNFVISIPRSITDISQIYYEKTDENLKIHLTADNANLRKENISFYFQDAKPDLIITLGMQNFKKQLEKKFDSFGYLLGSPILNIDNSQNNEKFGQENLIEQRSMSEIVLDVIKLIDEKPIAKNVANCLLAGLTIYYENFKSPKTTENVFLLASDLMKKGADNRQITDSLQKTSEKEMFLLGKVFKNLQQNNKFYVSVLESADTDRFSQSEVNYSLEKIKNLGIQNDLLILWPSTNSDPVTKGFLYSKNQELLNKAAFLFGTLNKNGFALLTLTQADVNKAKEEIIKSISE